MEFKQDSIYLDLQFIIKFWQNFREKFVRSWRSDSGKWIKEVLQMKFIAIIFCYLTAENEYLFLKLLSIISK